MRRLNQDDNLKKEQNSMMALAFGIIGMLLSCVGYGAIFGLIAIGFGVAGLKSSKGKQNAIAGIVLGALSVAMLFVVVLMNLTNQAG